MSPNDVSRMMQIDCGLFMNYLNIDKLVFVESCILLNFACISINGINMRFSIEHQDAITIFTLKEEILDANNAAEIKAEFLILCQPTVEALIIDLSIVKQSDSAGLGALLLAHRQMNEHEAPVILVGASERIMSLLRISQLDWLFEHAPSVDDAISMLEDDSGEA
jgi:anti-anti-sigma factor